jgi:hypothetical protein
VNNTNNFSARESYKLAKQLFVNAFSQDSNLPIGKITELVNGFKLSQSEIRLEVPLSTATTQFVFGVSDRQQATGNNGAPFNTETRLTLQDSICVNEIAMFVGAPSSSTDTSWQLRTYGNTQDFPTGADAINTTLLSHGKFEIKVNGDILVPSRGLSNFFYKPQTQQTAALGAASPDDQFRGAEDGSITMEPNIVLIGSKNNVITVNVPTALAAVDEYSRLIIICRGIFAQNSTVVS